MAEGSITQALEIGIIQISTGVDLEEVLRLFPEFAAEAAGSAGSRPGSTLAGVFRGGSRGDLKREL